MSSCCSSSSNTEIPKRHTCPENSKEYISVPFQTLFLHLKKPWDFKFKNLKEQGYYFCSDPNCDVVYFGEDNAAIYKTELRSLVGVKEPKNDNALSCYCFDITHSEARNNTSIRDYVIENTKNGSCSCESLNPSGRCCLKDFPKAD